MKPTWVFGEVLDALGGGLGTYLAPRGAQMSQRAQKAGSWLTRGPPFGLNFLICLRVFVYLLQRFFDCLFGGVGLRF